MPPKKPEPSAMPSISHIHITSTSILYTILLCLFLILFLRIVFFTLNCSSHYGIASGLEQRDTMSWMQREMTRTGASFVEFSTITPPSGSLYVPNLKLGTGRTSEPLLMAFRDEAEPLVELDALEGDRNEQHRYQQVNVVAVHGTNTLNTSWGWMA